MGAVDIDVAGNGTTSSGLQTLDLRDLSANHPYLLKISALGKTPTIYDIQFDLDANVSTLGDQMSLATRVDVTRRDVILGSEGNDILQGGAGEDWIFGGPGADVLTGGLDRNASDLLFGGPGNDTFQILTDALPLLGNQPGTVFQPATETIIPTFSDQLIGGEGDDQVLFLGGDRDRLGREVPDFVTLRYDTNLHRYEFTNMIWDVTGQRFLTEEIDSNGDEIPDYTVYQQQYMFYQTRDVERTVIATQDGDDVVRADAGFRFLPVELPIDAFAHHRYVDRCHNV